MIRSRFQSVGRFGAGALVCAAVAVIVGGGWTVLAQESRQSATARQAEGRAPTPALLLNADGRVRTGVMHGVSDAGVLFEESSGGLETRGRDRFLAVVATRERANPLDGIGVGPGNGDLDTARLRMRLEAEQQGVLELVDGQRFPGEPIAGEGAEDESILWRVRGGTGVSFPLDRVARVILPWAGIRRHTLVRDTSEDLIVLANGDELRGFVVEIDDVVRIESGSGEIEIDLERIAGIVLANPRERARGAMLWLDDGAVLRASSMSMQGDRVLIETALGVQIAPEAADIRGATFSAERIQALSSLQPTGQAPVGDRWRADPIVLRTHPDDLLGAESPTLGALDVFLPGPMRVDYELPRNAERLVATAALASEAGRWGDCELVMTVAGEELLRVHLHEGSARSAVNIPLEGVRSGATLTITLEPGRYGPIRNQVTLHRPLLILGE